MIFYFIYTLLLGAVWYFLVADIGYLGYAGLFLGLLTTFYSAFFIRYTKPENPFSTIVKFAVPSSFLIYTFATMLYTSIGAVFHPIIFAFLLLLTSVANANKIPPLHYQFFVVVLCYLYTFSIYDNFWLHPVFGAEARSLQVGISTPKPPTQSPIYIDLQHFKFVNKAKDTLQILPEGKFVILETWNEKCPPCMRAIPEMSVFYEQIKEKAHQYYIYIPNISKSATLDTDKVFNFEKIKEKEKVLIDQNLQQDLQLDSYPVFVVFDKDGKQVFQYIGYNKDEIIAGIQAIIK